MYDYYEGFYIYYWYYYDNFKNNLINCGDILYMKFKFLLFVYILDGWLEYVEEDEEEEEEVNFGLISLVKRNLILCWFVLNGVVFIVNVLWDLY